MNILLDTLVVNSDPSEILYECKFFYLSFSIVCLKILDLIEISQELYKKKDQLNQIIEESYKQDNTFNELEYEDIFSKSSFIADMLSQMDVIIKNYDQVHFNKFVKFATFEIEKTFGIVAKAYEPPPQPKIDTSMKLNMGLPREEYQESQKNIEKRGSSAGMKGSKFNRNKENSMDGFKEDGEKSHESFEFKKFKGKINV